MVTLVKYLYPLNTYAPIPEIFSVTTSSSTTLPPAIRRMFSKKKILSNALSLSILIFNHISRLGILSDRNCSHPPKALMEIDSIPLPKLTFSRLSQLQNAVAPIALTLSGNVTDIKF